MILTDDEYSRSRSTAARMILAPTLRRAACGAGDADPVFIAHTEEGSAYPRLDAFKRIAADSGRQSRWPRPSTSWTVSRSITCSRWIHRSVALVERRARLLPVWRGKRATTEGSLYKGTQALVSAAGYLRSGCGCPPHHSSIVRPGIATSIGPGKTSAACRRPISASSGSEKWVSMRRLTPASRASVAASTGVDVPRLPIHRKNRRATSTRRSGDRHYARGRPDRWRGRYLPCR